MPPSTAWAPPPVPASVVSPMTRLTSFWLTVVIAVSGGLTLQARAEAPPQTRQLSVNGVELSYIEQGTGTPVVFVHGAFSDVRFWEPQRQAVAKHYRFVAYNCRYHGAAPWPDDGKQYSAATHAADLAAYCLPSSGDRKSTRLN